MKTIENLISIAHEPRKQPNKIFKAKKLTVKGDIDCETTTAHKLRTRLGLKQYDVILTKEQSVLAKIESFFKGKNKKTQYRPLRYRADLYHHGYKFENEYFP